MDLIATIPITILMGRFFCGYLWAFGSRVISSGFYRANYGKNLLPSVRRQTKF